MEVIASRDPLDAFLPPVRAWFRGRLGQPTPVQTQGWPVIASGRSALLLAPTGSGKTLAAFLACLDGLWRRALAETAQRCVHVLYVSPLKALNNDIYRNLQVPLRGVAEMAEIMGTTLPNIEVAVRTGDTPTAQRQRLVRKPPHILITTPESLHLLLTSKARDVLRNVTHCIVDEIHALCPNKRGVFLSVLLERLQHLNAKEFVRIGLSATQRPLDEVARFLGGFLRGADGSWHARPVTIVDSGARKNLDLLVVSPVEQFGPLPEKTIWPAIYRRLASEIRQHRSTIIFANNRRSVERITGQLNDVFADDPVAVESKESLDVQEGEKGTGGEWETDTPTAILPLSDSPIPPVRAHHGSVALEVRQQTEQALKEGRLRAVVATASLELGIDMGAVDLVCQVESPGNVARGLQRVGRAGHLVGQSSKGRLIPKTLPDLLNQAVLAAEMAAGRVEALRVPMNCLDVLAQQVIAMTAVDDWPVAGLYQLIRQAYPYHELTPAAFDAVLEMVSGRYRFVELDDVAETEREGEKGSRGEGESGRAPRRLAPAQQLTALQPRISWDRIHQVLRALPGSQRMALVHGGTIPDTGQYAVYTNKNVRIGEVDEEFVYERRIGDAFTLGTNAWRIDRIEVDRVMVHAAEGMPAMVPFWRGEATGRSYDLGLAQGAFLRELAERIDKLDCLDWLEHHYFLDAAAARNLRDFVQRQIHRTKCLPTDHALVIEASRDPLGDWQVILLSPFGRALNLSLRLAIEHRMQQRLGYRPQCMHHDDGILIRLTESDEPVLDLFEGMTAANVRDMILNELADSALFALRFRQNAARALMMPRGAAGKRAPLWLQRLRGRDLLQVARRHPDFPIIAETFRECLHDHLDLPRLQQLLNDVGSGTVTIETRRLDMPSPFGAGLLFAFTMAFMYQYDDVESSGGAASASLDQALLDQLIGHDGQLPLDRRAVQQVDRRLRGVGHPPRTKAETAEWLRRLGDVARGELEGAAGDFLAELEREKTVTRIKLNGQDRWILAEEADHYRRAFATDLPNAHEAAAQILRRFLDTHALVGLDDVLARYPFDRTWAQQQLEEWTRSGRLVRVVVAEAEPVQWSAPENLDQMQRGTLSVLRREVVTCPPAQFADFLLRWQHVHPATQVALPHGLPDVMRRLQGPALPLELWEHAIVPLRCQGKLARHLDDLTASGRWLWHCRPSPLSPLPEGEGKGVRGRPDTVGFVERETIGMLMPPVDANTSLDQVSMSVMDLLRTRGALFTAEIAEQTKGAPAVVRASLWSLCRSGLVTNDQLDVLRRGEPPREDEPPPMRSRTDVRAFLRDARRRRDNAWPEGRWSLIAWGQPEPEAAAFFQAQRLLHRYGIVARELALMANAPAPWRILYEIYSRMELAGDVRRGYFVEGLSGAQFALPEAAKLLHDIAAPSSMQAPAILVHSLDPANVYGGALELVLPGAEPRSLQRRPGNWLVVKAGRPILVIEQHGKRLTASAPASYEELVQAVARLPDLLKLNPTSDVRHKLTVETWNDSAVTMTPGKDLLEQVGFVRDYQAMTLYAVWQ